MGSGCEECEGTGKCLSDMHEIEPGCGKTAEECDDEFCEEHDACELCNGTGKCPWC